MEKQWDEDLQQQKDEHESELDRIRLDGEMQLAALREDCEKAVAEHVKEHLRASCCPHSKSKCCRRSAKNSARVRQPTFATG